MPPPLPPNRRAPAFTLLELLLASAIGVILLASMMKMSSSLLRSGLRENNQQSVQDAWTRVQHFLTIEVGEAAHVYQLDTTTNTKTKLADPIVLNPSTIGCTGATRDAGTGSFSINVPRPGATATPYFKTIAYYVQNSRLMRCGPPVLANGSIDLAPTTSNASSVLSYNTVLTQVNFVVVNTTTINRSIDYTLQFRSPQAGVELTKTGRAWAQSSNNPCADANLQLNQTCSN